MAYTYTKSDFEAYLQGTMQASAKASFEASLKEDPELREDLELYLSTREVLHEAYRFDLRAQLIAIDAEMDQKVAKRNTSIWKRIAIAASFLLVAAVAAWLFAGSYYSKHSILARLAEPIEADQWRSGGGELDEESVAAYLSVADTHFMAGEYREASEGYAKVASSENLRADYAEWHLLLSRFMIDDSSPAFQDLLDTLLSDPSHPYHKDAVKLQNAIHSPFFH